MSKIRGVQVAYWKLSINCSWEC